MRISIPTILASTPVAVARSDYKVLFAFNPAVAIENIAETLDGHLLLTTLYDKGQLYILDPKAATPSATPIAALPGCDGLTGIQETAPNVFAVTGGPLGATGFEGLKTFNVTVQTTPEPRASVIEVASIPNTAMLNGMATISHTPGIILSCDSFRGTVVRINTITGAVDNVAEDALFKPTSSVSLGINGLDALDGFLYFTNSAQGIVGRMPIDKEGRRAGVTEILATLPHTPSRTNMYDDFALRHGCSSDKPEMYIAQQANAIWHLKEGVQTLFLGGGNSTELQVPTSAIFSRDGRKIYIVTGGGQVLQAEVQQCRQPCV